MITDIRILIFSLLFLLVACNNKKETPEPEPTPPSDVVAFSGAEGGGSWATGGRGGYVFAVTSLEDNDAGAGEELIPGTIRYALAQQTKRIIVFTVAGVVHLKSPLTISNGNLTVLGQTAPGDGICIADYPVKIENADNVILRFLRFRMGDNKLTAAQADDADALSVNNCNNVIIDHCSFSWSTDECVSCYGNKNFTLQYCFITESLRKSKHDKGNHGYGGIWGGKNASFHHNLIAHHDSRNPRFDHDFVDVTCAGPIDYVNNVVYNWGGNSTYGGEGTNKGAGGRHINMVNNYYKYGPATSRKNRLVDPTVSCKDYCAKSPGGTVEPGKFWLIGNYMFEDANVTDDNWQGSTQKGDNVKASARWTDGLTALKSEQTAENAYATVLAKAGCSLKRDAIDARIVTEVEGTALHGGYTYTGSKSGMKGIIDTPSDVGGWPVYSGTANDSDNDGMPNQWEIDHGLNPNDRKDAATATINTSYANVEVYANELVKDLY
ncbi:MAG: pectate lyase [Paludibacteraceae bacterium]|nr:pectate lyase [Paludibacteraceae bacterium]MBR6167343.1 pectate lyase [Paludibacteraceae bacterium]